MGLPEGVTGGKFIRSQPATARLAEAFGAETPQMLPSRWPRFTLVCHHLSIISLRSNMITVKHLHVQIGCFIFYFFLAGGVVLLLTSLILKHHKKKKRWRKMELKVNNCISLALLAGWSSI